MRRHSVHDILVVIDDLRRLLPVIICHSQVIVIRLWASHRIVALHVAFVNLLDGRFRVNQVTEAAADDASEDGKLPLRGSVCRSADRV